MPDKENNAVYYEGFLFSLMVALGETFLVPYALSVGVSETLSSIISCLPLLVGALCQIPIVTFSRFQSPRLCLCIIASLQATCLILLALPNAFGPYRELGHLYLAIGITLYWALGFSAGPIWNKFFVAIHKNFDLKRLFFKRNTVSQCGSIFGLLIATVALGSLTSSSQDATKTLAWLMIVAGIARYGSAFMYTRHPYLTPEVKTDKDKWFCFKFLQKPCVVPALIFCFLTNIAVFTSASFFAVYQLRELNMSYLEFNGLIATAFISRILATYILNDFVQRVGVKLLLGVGAVGIIPLPALWAVSDHMLWLVFLQVLAGIAWSSHELGTTLVLIESVAEKERSQLLTWSNLLNTLGIAFGLAIGLYIIEGSPLSKPVYHNLFYASSALRVLPLFLLPHLMSVRAKPIIFRTLSLMTSTRGFYRPVLVPKSRK